MNGKEIYFGMEEEMKMKLDPFSQPEDIFFCVYMCAHRQTHVCVFYLKWYNAMTST